MGGSDAAITVITREPTEALFMELKSDISCMKNVVETKYVLKKDNHVVDMITSGGLGGTAIGFGAARNFPEELHIAVDGFSSGVRLGLVYAVAKGGDPLVRAARETAAGEGWQKELQALQLGQP